MEVQAWFVVFASKHERFHGPSAQDGIYRKHHGGGAIPNIPLGSWRGFFQWYFESIVPSSALRPFGNAPATGQALRTRPNPARLDPLRFVRHLRESIILDTYRKPVCSGFTFGERLKTTNTTCSDWFTDENLSPLPGVKIWSCASIRRNRVRICLSLRRSQGCLTSITQFCLPRWT